MAGPDSPGSCYLLQTEDNTDRTWSLVLDLGSGAFGALQQHIDPRDIDAICLSHLHADHCADLVGLAVWARYAPGGPLPPIPCYGPSTTVWRVRQLADHGRGERGGIDAYAAAPARPAPSSEGTTARGTIVAGGAFRVRNWVAGRQVQVGPFTITPSSARHPVEAYSIRVVTAMDHPNQAVFVYSGDSDLVPELEDSARGADLLLCEAGFVHGRDTVGGVHMTGRQAGELAAKAGAGKLVVTHVAPWDDKATAVADARLRYDGPIEAASPGAVYQVDPVEAVAK
jgi:ribonuclease BN (tRNA processing enzyme)